MSETHIDEILKQLGSHASHEAWSMFLDEYAPLILQLVRHFEKESDPASDCFQFICERLCEDRFRRLRRFKPGGPAKFSTWLRLVVRNLCVDWRRKQFGRRRVFRSISRLSDLDQEIFRLVHERGATEQEAFVSLARNFPGLSTKMVSEAIERVNGTLTRNQNWLLRARSVATSQRSVKRSDGTESAEVADSSSNPEALAIGGERSAMLNRALWRLSFNERLLIRLRFEEDLTLDQIAKLLKLGNAQRVDRQIKQILSSLRRELNSADAVDVSGKNSPSSVKAG